MTDFFESDSRCGWRTFKLNLFSGKSRVCHMKFLHKTLFLFAMTIAVGLTGCSDSSGDLEVEGRKQLYTCGMHPEVIQEEPGRCPICHMNLTPMNAETPEEHAQHELETGKPGSEKKIIHWRAPMDPSYISDKPGKSPMGMDLIPVYEGEEVVGGNTISIDPVTVQSIGVRTAKVARRPFSRIVRTVGHLDYNEEKLCVVNTKFNGWIEKMFVERTGDLVQKGQPLFAVYSPELVTTQQEYLLALENFRKVQSASNDEIRKNAENLLAASRRRLTYWDISEKQIAELETEGKTKKSLTIHAPAGGVVMHKNAVEGMSVKAGEELFRIGDISSIWVIAHVFESDLPWIRVGQTAEMELTYLPGKKFTGRIDYIYPYLDQKTRDVKLRLVFDNPGLQLKPQMYANIRLESRIGNDILVIPAEAILRSGVRNVVFVDLGEGKFAPREIVTGAEGDGGLVRVVSGLNEGETIVTSAQFLLDSESRLREAIQKMLEMKKN